MKIIKTTAALLCKAALIFGIMTLFGCAPKRGVPEIPYEIDGIRFTERVCTAYAEQFTIDRCDEGYSMIYIGNGDRFLIVPEGAGAPDGIDDDIKIINRPIGNIYLAATAAMDLFDSLGRGNAIKFSGSEADEWYIDYARRAMESGDMLYAGNYSAPDYEMLLTNGCDLSIQSTMIDYAPDVKEKLEDLGITVLTDYSSYETHPLGRSEWIRVYAEILDEADKADILMKEQAERLEAASCADTGKTAAFFYINGSGQAVTRKSSDYVSRMMEMAGGRNVFTHLENDDRLSTIKLEPEEFYKTAKDADIIIYNSTIGGEVHSIDEMIAKNELLADFKAVRTGDVWCTRESLYQETMDLGAVLEDLRAVFAGDTESHPPVYLFRLERSDVK